jgi:hypothetical protein
VTTIAFFLAEMGDKMQIATAVLAARYDALVAVIAGTTIGMPRTFPSSSPASRRRPHSVRRVAESRCGHLRRDGHLGAVERRVNVTARRCAAREPAHRPV